MLDCGESIKTIKKGERWINHTYKGFSSNISFLIQECLHIN